MQVQKRDSITDRIHTIRGLKVMLDKDLAMLYDVDIKQLNRAVKRNIERFPENFMFQLNETEFECLRSQIASIDEKGISDKDSLRRQIGTLEGRRGKHRKYLPYAFTEQGVSMLSGVLRSKTAIKVSIQIMNAFVSMRRFISKNAELFSRLDSVERKQLEYQSYTDERFKKVFDAIENEEVKQGIFFEGRIFDAYRFVSDLVRSAKKSIVLIDNFVDDTVLTLFSKREKSVSVVIYTNVSRQLRLDLAKFNSQYPPVKAQEFARSHDRFLIVDGSTVYHIGASLKDLGKKWFAFSRFDKNALRLLDEIDK